MRAGDFIVVGQAAVAKSGGGGDDDEGRRRWWGMAKKGMYEDLPLAFFIYTLYFFLYSHLYAI